MKSSPIRSKIDAIEIERAQIVQNPHMNLINFERFFEKPTKTPARPKKSIFLARKIRAKRFWINCLNSIIFKLICLNRLCRTIVSEKVYIFAGHQNQAKNRQIGDNSRFLPLFKHIAPAAFPRFSEPYKALISH